MGIQSTDDSLLLESLRVDPDWVNAYFVLAQRFAARDALSGRALAERLLSTWAEVDRKSTSGHQFVREFAEWDPFELEGSLRDCLPEPALILRMADDLSTLDVLEHDRGRGAEGLTFLGRIHQPRLMCSLRDCASFPPMKKAIFEDL
ncbi:MAG TPA: hypothetical protein VGB96_09730, partial [Archangium sp.]